jgi:hypothetical protein
MFCSLSRVAEPIKTLKTCERKTERKEKKKERKKKEVRIG